MRSRPATQAILAASLLAVHLAPTTFSLPRRAALPTALDSHCEPGAVAAGQPSCSTPRGSRAACAGAPPLAMWRTGRGVDADALERAWQLEPGTVKMLESEQKLFADVAVPPAKTCCKVQKLQGSFPKPVL